MNVLVVCAHPDDEVLGCGGTIARHVADGDHVHVLFVADGESSRIMHNRGERNSAALRASKILGHTMKFLDHNDQRLDQLGLLDITRDIEAEIILHRPEVIYTHHVGDLNEDHRIVHQATMTAARPLPNSLVREIHCFEVPSSTEWGSGFWPSYFVDIDVRAGEKTARGKKFEALRCYEAEMREVPHARSYDAVHGLIELRGYSCGRFAAEAFVTMRRIR